MKARRAASVAVNARTTVQSILANVLQVTNVLDAYAIDNSQSTSQTVGGVTIGPNAVYVCVAGGASYDIATAILAKKPPGCNTSGSTAVIVQDTNPLYSPPYPQYTINYQVAAATPILFSVVMASSQQVPSNALTLVQNAIIEAFSGADGGSRARIGSTIYASRFYSSIASLGSWAQIISLEIGISAANENVVVMQINQVPTVAASNITLTLQ